MTKIPLGERRGYTGGTGSPCKSRRRQAGFGLPQKSARFVGFFAALRMTGFGRYPHAARTQEISESFYAKFLFHFLCKESGERNLTRLSHAGPYPAHLTTAGILRDSIVRVPATTTAAAPLDINRPSGSGNLSGSPFDKFLSKTTPARFVVGVGDSRGRASPVFFPPFLTRNGEENLPMAFRDCPLRS